MAEPRICVVAYDAMEEPDAALAQSSCPPEVEQARAMLASVQAQKPSRTAAAARGKEQQASRGQDQQAPRGQDQQAPRGQDQQAPRATGADAKARAAMLDTASRLVRDAQGACKADDNPRASANARAALELLTYLR